MKRLSFIIFFFLVCTSSYAEEQFLIVTGEWAPYVSQKLPEYGYTAEIVKKSFSEMGISVHYKFYSWKRATLMVSKGACIGAFPYVETPERKEFAFFSEPFCMSDSKFFYYNEKFKDITYEDVKELNRFNIGTTLGYASEKNLQKEGLKTDSAPTDLLNLRKLIRGRIDLFASSSIVAWNLIKKEFPNDIKKFGTLQKPYSKYKLALIISKKIPNAQKYIATFNEGLKKIKDKGIYKQILDKHGIIENP